MADADDVERLRWELNKYGLGAVSVMTNQAASAVFSATRSVADMLRRYTDERPFITLLLAFQAGYLVSRTGRRHARS